MSVFAVTGGRYTEWGPDVWAAMQRLNEPQPEPPEPVEPPPDDEVPDEPFAEPHDPEEGEPP